MKFFTDILPIIISLITLVYAIWIDSRRRRLENILIEPKLSFNSIEKYGHVDKPENYLSYYIKNKNELTTMKPFNVLVSIKNNSSGIAKNIQMIEKDNPNFSIDVKNDITLDIGANQENSILFMLAPSLYKEDKVFNFRLNYKDIYEKDDNTTIQFKISPPIFKQTERR